MFLTYGHVGQALLMAWFLAVVMRLLWIALFLHLILAEFYGTQA